MPYPLSVRPARPGDGSGICEPRHPDREEREREQYDEERYDEERVREKRREQNEEAEEE